MSPINPLTGVRANLSAPFGPPVAGEKDIRYSYPLAGGTMMDMGVYPLSAGLYTMRVAGGTDKRAEWADGVEVREARPRYFQPTDKEVLEKKTHLDANGELAIDEAMTAT